MQFYLDIPFGVREEGVRWDSRKKSHIYSGAVLPSRLRQYATKDYSLLRWKEDEANKHVQTPLPSEHEYKLHKHQYEDGVNIATYYNRGMRGCLLASETGVGKTLSGLAGVCFSAQEHGYGIGRKRKARTLIVTNLAAIPHWRETLQSYPPSQAFLRPMIINYQQLLKLLIAPKLPPTKRKRSTTSVNRMTAKHGKPLIDWDYIIFDEAHALKNYPNTTTGVAAATVAKLEQNYIPGETPFVIFCTATPGATPLNLSLMSGFIAPLLFPGGGSERITPSKWGSFLQKTGFAVTKGKKGDYNWAVIPWYGKNSTHPDEVRKQKEAEARALALQKRDTHRIGKALKSKGAPFIRRIPQDIAGWEEQQLIPLPIELTPEQVPVYQELWSRFRRFLNLSPANKDPKTALVENLRYRQKSSLLKIPTVSAFISDLVESGNQVYVSMEFIESVEALADSLRKKKIRVVTITGQNTSERENNRIRFQKGEADVVLTTVTESISLHAKQKLSDGTLATSKPRVTIIFDVRANPEAAKQSLGRAHRDGQNSIAYFPYLRGTVDEKVINSFVRKGANMGTMVGETLQADYMEKVFMEAAARKN